MRKLLGRLLVEDNGQGLVEYTLIVVLVALVFWVAIKNTNIGSGLAAGWSKVTDCVSDSGKLYFRLLVSIRGPLPEMAAVFPFLKEESRPFRQSLGARIDHLVADRLILGPIRHQAPAHRPRLDGAGALDNDRMRLRRRDIVVRRKIQIVEDLPAHLDLAKLESRFESSTHDSC